MKKVPLVVIGLVAILLLDWAALDDITTGNEPNYYLEYLTLAGSVLIFGFLIFKFFPRKK